MKLRETSCVYGTEGPGRKGEEGQQREKAGPGAEGQKGPAKGKTRPKSRRRGKGPRIRVYILEHAKQITSIINSPCRRPLRQKCRPSTLRQGYGKGTLRQGYLERYLATRLSKDRGESTLE